MSTGTLVLFILGLVLLIAGAEALVRGASRLAALAGISRLVIGLTVVALGTGSPELAVSVQAALQGQADLAIGNVVGSNICNILLILGISALIAPLTVSLQLVRIDVPVMIGVSVLLLLLALDGRISRLDGAVLVAGAVVYTASSFYLGRREEAKTRALIPGPTRRRPEASAGSLAVSLLLIVVGLVALVIGSRWLVDGAVELAATIGLSELVIGLTVVAAGTSLPEIATSVLAGLRGQRDIAVGNAVGSCIFNILVILGITGVIAPAGIAVARAAQTFDIPVMIATAVACLPIFFTGRLIARWEGALFLAYYAAYTLFLLLDAAGHDALPVYSTVMLAFVLPITAVTLGTLSFRALVQQRTRRVPSS
jgi:cation:H+ antiporter